MGEGHSEGFFCFSPTEGNTAGRRRGEPGQAPRSLRRLPKIQAKACEHQAPCQAKPTWCWSTTTAPSGSCRCQGRLRAGGEPPSHQLEARSAPRGSEPTPPASRRPWGKWGRRARPWVRLELSEAPEHPASPQVGPVCSPPLGGAPASFSQIAPATSGAAKRAIGEESRNGPAPPAASVPLPLIRAHSTFRDCRHGVLGVSHLSIPPHAAKSTLRSSPADFAPLFITGKPQLTAPGSGEGAERHGSLLIFLRATSEPLLKATKIGERPEQLVFPVLMQY